MSKTTKSTKATSGTAAATKTPRTRKAKTEQTPEQVERATTIAAEQEAEAIRLNTEAAASKTETPAAEAKPVKAPKVLPTLVEALVAAHKANPSRFAHVESVTELSKDGTPKRVVIRCSDPQTKQGADGKQVLVCTGTREIAVQDLFQVECCAACADRKVRKARRNRAKVRAKAAKAMLKARNS